MFKLKIIVEKCWFVCNYYNNNMLGNMMHAMVFFESKDNFHYLEIMKTFYCFTSQKSMNKKVALITFFLSAWNRWKLPWSKCTLVTIKVNEKLHFGYFHFSNKWKFPFFQTYTIASYGFRVYRESSCNDRSSSDGEPGILEGYPRSIRTTWGLV